jgi:hypothetical protein
MSHKNVERSLQEEVSTQLLGIQSHVMQCPQINSSMLVKQSLLVQRLIKQSKRQKQQTVQAKPCTGEQ